MKPGTHKSRVALLPFPARVVLDVSRFDGLHPSDGFNHMGLRAGAFLGATKDLAA